MQTRGVKIILGVAAIVQLASLCAVLFAMFMQNAFKRQMMSGIHTDIFVVPYASLISTGIILVVYAVGFGIVMGTGEEGSKVKAVAMLICLVVLKTLCSYVGIVGNVMTARKGAEFLAVYGTLESYASMWSSPFALAALVLFCFGMGQYYDCQDR